MLTMELTLSWHEMLAAVNTWLAKRKGHIL